MSAQNRMILAQETLKGGNTFKNYAKRVVSKDVNNDAMGIKEFSVTNTGKTKNK